MKLLILVALLVSAMAFSPAPKTATRKLITLDMVSRREAIVAGAAALLAGAAPAVASQAGIGSDRDFAKDNEVIQAQQATGGKIDLNSAPVVSFRCEAYLS
jgi:hypothetical protein